MGSRVWGKAYHTGFNEGFINCILLVSALHFADSVLSLLGDYISTRKTKAERLMGDNNRYM